MNLLKIIPSDGTVAAVETRVEATIIIGDNSLKNVVTALDRAQRIG